MRKVSFHVTGTHCRSCKILIEDTLKEQGLALNPNVDIKHETLTIETESDQTPETLAATLSQTLAADGYQVSVDKTAPESVPDKNLLWQALPLGLLVLALFVLLQKSGLLNLGIGGVTTPVTSFLIGLIASVSSCLAIVGGLVLSLSAKVSQDDVDDTKNILLFHGGRIGSFALGGGILGSVGGVLGVNFTFAAILGLVASIIMLFLGLDLAGLLPKSALTLPTSIFTALRKIEHETLTPLLLGAGTFFLPCGFTQSMQVAALSSGSFGSGLLIMFAFSLGTLPMLSLLSFGSASFSHSRYAPLFFRTAGIVVLGLGGLSFLAGLASLGIIAPLFTL